VHTDDDDTKAPEASTEYALDANAAYAIIANEEDEVYFIAEYMIVIGCLGGVRCCVLLLF